MAKETKNDWPDIRKLVAMYDCESIEKLVADLQVEINMKNTLIELYEQRIKELEDALEIEEP